MDLLINDSFQSTASLSATTHLGLTVETLTSAYADAMRTTLSDTYQTSIAEQFKELSGVRQTRQAIEEFDRFHGQYARDLVRSCGQVALDEIARQRDVSRLVGDYSPAGLWANFESVGRIAAAAAPWFEQSESLRKQAEAWSDAGKQWVKAALWGSDAVSGLESEARAWDALQSYARTMMQPAGAQSALSSMDFAQSAIADALKGFDAHDLFRQAFDADRTLSGLVDWLDVMGSQAHNGLLGSSVHRWADESLGERRSWSPTRFQPESVPAPLVDDEQSDETKKRAIYALARLWRVLKANVPQYVALFAVGVAANMVGAEYAMWRAKASAAPMPAQAPAPAPPSATPIVINTEHITAVTATGLVIRQGPSSKHQVLTSVGYGQLLRVMKAGANGWSLVEYDDPIHPGVRVSGWVDAAYAKKVDAETLLYLWCNTTVDSSKPDACRLH